jgi:hypothetical protein
MSNIVTLAGKNFSTMVPSSVSDTIGANLLQDLYTYSSSANLKYKIANDAMANSMLSQVLSSLPFSVQSYLVPKDNAGVTRIYANNILDAALSGIMGNTINGTIDPLKSMITGMLPQLISLLNMTKTNGYVQLLDVA